MEKTMPSTKKIPLAEAVGLPLAHDITEVNPEKGFKGRAFKKGHLISEHDLEKLAAIGKNEIFILDLDTDQIHENDAAVMMAGAFAGRYVAHDLEPKEGKINFQSQKDGLLRVDTEKLLAINLLGDPSCMTKPTNLPVNKGEIIASTRIIPLFTNRQVIEQALEIAKPEGVFHIIPFRARKAGVIVTGNEVYHGLVEDRFLPVVSRKLAHYQAELYRNALLPDDQEEMVATIRSFIAAGCEIIILTGGTSVDPNDVTPLAISEAGGRNFIRGVPLQPGNMFCMAWINHTDREIPVCAVPAAALFYPHTAFDVFLPQLLAGQQPDKKAVASLGHGGLCHFCQQCVYPVCSFGRG
jgi:molybdenum cofactor synthesis domain-containing protein